MNSMVQCKMDIIFTNSGNSKTSDLHRLLLNLSEKNKLKKGAIKILLYQTLASTIYKKNVNLKYQLQRGMKKLNYQTNHILYQIFKIVSSMSSKNMKP